jgi:DNA-directed RNA polymerase subunit N (RpoN/RPB10)
MESLPLKTCVTCGEPLHAERAERYDYCARAECRERNAKPLEIVAIGVNKAAEQYVALTDRTRREMESGRYKRVSYFPSAKRKRARMKRTRSRAPEAKPSSTPRPWTKPQQDLAVIYRDRGMRPDEIADKLGVSRYLVSQMLLAAGNRGTR